MENNEKSNGKLILGVIIGCVTTLVVMGVMLLWFNLAKFNEVNDNKPVEKEDIVKPTEEDKDSSKVLTDDEKQIKNMSTDKMTYTVVECEDLSMDALPFTYKKVSNGYYFKAKEDKTENTVVGDFKQMVTYRMRGGNAVGEHETFLIDKDSNLYYVNFLKFEAKKIELDGKVDKLYCVEREYLDGVSPITQTVVVKTDKGTFKDIYNLANTWGWES